MREYAAMPHVRKSAIVPRACEDLFDLVDRVEDYPEFLPWCASTTLIERDDAITSARLDIDFKGLKSHLVTRNRKEAPRAMAMELVEGPFSDFAGRWRFEPLGDEGCRVELEIEYAFSNRALEAVLGPVFGHITQTLVERFVARAESLRDGGNR
jgi:ribosome-associated toxin RatA of RatAB toxin-antitoxin module